MPLKDGDVVAINYTIKVIKDGEEEVYATTREDIAKKYGIYDPNKVYKEEIIIIGKTKLLEAIEETLKEMNVGDKKEIIAPPEKAFGSYNKELVLRVPIKTLRRRKIRPAVGEEVTVNGRKGYIKRVTERFAYIDFNHPLAGKTLKIELEVVRKIESEEEKLRYLAARWFGVDEEKVKAEINEKEATIVLPPEVALLTDLDAILRALLNDLYELTDLSKVSIKIDFEFKREEEERTKTEGKPIQNEENEEKENDQEQREEQTEA